jgi:hypothetical protein
MSEVAAAPAVAARRTTATAQRWFDAALKLEDWMRARDYAGYDPHDLLGSPIVTQLTFRNRWLATLWTQLGKRSPVELRGLLRVPRHRNAKGIGLVLSSHALLAQVDRGPRFRQSARDLIAWLASTASYDVHGAAWGYPFPWANRDFFAPAGTPSSVATAFVVEGLLDARDLLGLEDAGKLAVRAGGFLLDGLNRIPGTGAEFAFSYTPLDRRVVHNANVLVAAALARLAAHTGDEAFEKAALQAARFTARAQRTDGSWSYGVGARNSWVDSFHTSYTLVALDSIGRWLYTDEFDSAVERGLDFWRETFLRGPAVTFHPGSAYPIDTHAVAHAIVTLIHFRARVPEAMHHASRLAAWCLNEMQSPEGYFYYQKHRAYVNRRVYMRWTQQWMLRALGALAVAEHEAKAA